MGIGPTRPCNRIITATDFSDCWCLITFQGDLNRSFGCCDYFSCTVVSYFTSSGTGTGTGTVAPVSPLGSGPPVALAQRPAASMMIVNLSACKRPKRFILIKEAQGALGQTARESLASQSARRDASPCRLPRRGVTEPAFSRELLLSRNYSVVPRI